MYRFMDINKYRIRFACGAALTVYDKDLQSAKQQAANRHHHKYGHGATIIEIRRT